MIDEALESFSHWRSARHLRGSDHGCSELSEVMRWFDVEMTLVGTSVTIVGSNVFERSKSMIDAQADDLREWERKKQLGWAWSFLCKHDWAWSSLVFYGRARSLLHICGWARSSFSIHSSFLNVWRDLSNTEPKSPPWVEPLRGPLHLQMATHGMWSFWWTCRSWKLTRTPRKLSWLCVRPMGSWRLGAWLFWNMNGVRSWWMALLGRHFFIGPSYPLLNAVAHFATRFAFSLGNGNTSIANLEHSHIILFGMQTFPYGVLMWTPWWFYCSFEWPNAERQSASEALAGPRKAGGLHLPFTKRLL